MYRTYRVIGCRVGGVYRRQQIDEKQSRIKKKKVLDARKDFFYINWAKSKDFDIKMKKFQKNGAQTLDIYFNLH